MRRSISTLASIAILMGMALFAAAPASAQYSNGYRDDGSLVRCESIDGRSRMCPTRGGRVVLERQISDSPCIEGSSWRQDRGGIWVSRGCRADFRVLGYGGGYGNGYGTVIRCESNNGRSNECPTGGGRISLERQVSDAPCIEGRSWGRSRGGVWVSQGCRADFRIQADGDYQGGGDQVVRCESSNNRYNRCAVYGRGRPRLLRQVSSAPCIEGRSWGAERDAVWVSNGCRGDFTSSGRGGWADSGYGSRVFRCESNDQRYQQCAANIRTAVQLIRQLSDAPCVEGRSWGYAKGGIWVSNGCRAEFRSY